MTEIAHQVSSGSLTGNARRLICQLGCHRLKESTILGFLLIGRGLELELGQGLRINAFIILESIFLKFSSMLIYLYQK